MSIFLKLIIFKFIYKNNPSRTLFTPYGPFGRASSRGAAGSLCRATCTGAAEVPRRQAGDQACQGGIRRGPACRASPPGAARLSRLPAWRGGPN
jgi:hypothetical protein